MIVLLKKGSLNVFKAGEEVIDRENFENVEQKWIY